MMLLLLALRVYALRITDIFPQVSVAHHFIKSQTELVEEDGR